MRYILFAITSFTFLLISCKKDTPKISIYSGVYKGTFERNINSNLSNVTLIISGNKFDGQSEDEHYPAICNGNFNINKDTISFVNNCAFTADFDWSYILSGKFKFSVLEDSLILMRSYDGIIYYYDTYNLKKQ
jgi:hypothetical protein